MEFPVQRWRRTEDGIQAREEEERGIAIMGNFGSIEELDRNGEMRGVVL